MIRDWLTRIVIIAVSIEINKPKIDQIIWKLILSSISLKNISGAFFMVYFL